MTSRRLRRETSAGGVVFRLEGGQPQFLLIRDRHRNWGFPKGHIEAGEEPAAAAIREVTEETGVGALTVHGLIEVIDWRFRHRGRLVHKTCHFFLMETQESKTAPQRDEGIVACRWVEFHEGRRRLSYANARDILARAHDMLSSLVGSVA